MNSEIEQAAREARAIIRPFLEGRGVVCYAGSRRYARKYAVRNGVRRLAASRKPVFLITGTGPEEKPSELHGVDETAILEAMRIGLPYAVFSADWERHGRKAGPIRNSILVGVADHVVCWWDLSSRGTADTLIKAYRQDKLRKVYGPDAQEVPIPDALLLASSCTSAYYGSGRTSIRDDSRNTFRI